MIDRCCLSRKAVIDRWNAVGYVLMPNNRILAFCICRGAEILLTLGMKQPKKKTGGRKGRKESAKDEATDPAVDELEYAESLFR